MIAAKRDYFQWIFGGLILSMILFQLFMIQRVNIHPDEFRELSSLYSMESGYEMGPFKNGMHYLIWPLKYWDTDEATIAIAARYLSYLGVLGIYLMLFKLGNLLQGSRLGLSAAFVCAFFTSFTECSVEYRSDPIITFCLLASMFLVLRPAKPGTWLVPGLLLGFALFLNPKACYHFAGLGLVYGYFVCFSKSRGAWVLSGLACATVTLTLFFFLIILHCRLYNLPLSELGSSMQVAANGGFGKILGWPLKNQFLRGIVVHSPGPLLCIVLGFVWLVWSLIKGRVDRLWVPVLAVALLETGTFFIHQGVFKYYIVDILPPLALIGGLPLTVLMNRIGESHGLTRRLSVYPWVALVLLCFFGLAFRLRVNIVNTIDCQRTYFRLIHRLFPEPVNYFDGFGMISRYNNVGGLFIGKTITMYQLQNQPLFPQWQVAHFPSFMLNSSLFGFNDLLPEDKKFVLNHFQGFFGGTLWIHGFSVPAGLDAPIQQNFYLSGDYCYEGEGLLVDGKSVASPFFLEKGLHTLQASGSNQLQVTFGKIPPRQVVDNFQMPRMSKGEFKVSEAGRYYPKYSNGFGQGVLIDGHPLIDRLWPEEMRSIYLDVGAHTYLNGSNYDASIDVLGPIFVFEVWSGAR